eukprot:NODE_146_length_17563_cov_0.253321.p10 type:complete len:114 gc:universal NODE_146_length_17563_cov_0.253321:14785-14444(-)
MLPKSVSFTLTLGTIRILENPNFKKSRHNVLHSEPAHSPGAFKLGAMLLPLLNLIPLLNGFIDMTAIPFHKHPICTGSPFIIRSLVSLSSEISLSMCDLLTAFPLVVCATQVS